MTIPETTNVLDHLVARVFEFEEVTLGDPKDRFIVRYVGHLRSDDSAAAYDELAAALKPYDVTPLFRWDDSPAPDDKLPAEFKRYERLAPAPQRAGKRQVITLIKGLPNRTPSNPWVNVALFILTVISVMFAGAMYSYTGPVPSDYFGALLVYLKNIVLGWPFAVSLLAILVSHEFGHYIAGRIHHTNVSLPYFIPFPLSILGTMGAFINMKEMPKNRRILLDIGLAGPLAGIIVAIPVLLYGLSLSATDTLPATLGTPFSMEGNSLLYLLSKLVVFGKLLPSPATYGNLAPILYWVRYFFTGQPVPLGGVDVMIHPIALAGWAGILVTSLNLIPVGQLDGGHVFYVLFGTDKARRIYPFILVALVLLGFAWNGWWLWAVLLFVLGRLYAEPLDQITPLDGRRKALAVVALLLFLLVFTPVPWSIYGA